MNISIYSSISDVQAEILLENTCSMITPSTSGVINIVESPKMPLMMIDVDCHDFVPRKSPVHEKCLSLGVGK